MYTECVWDTDDDAGAMLDFAVGRRARHAALAACAAVRPTLARVPAGELRPLRALETAEAWARCTATADDVRRAYSAACVASTDTHSAPPPTSLAMQAIRLAACVVTNVAVAGDAARLASFAAGQLVEYGAPWRHVERLCLVARAESLRAAAPLVRAHLPWSLVARAPP